MRHGIGSFLDLQCPVRVVTVGWGGHRQRGHDVALVVVNRCRDALEAELGFFVVVGDTMAANLVQFLFQRGQGGQ